MRPWCSTHDDPCTSERKSAFSGLGYGIYLGNIFQVSRPSLIHKAEFEKCLFSIHNRNVNGVTVSECSFDLGELPDTENTNEQVGIVFETVSLPFTISQNTFTGSQVNAARYGGVQCTQTGEMNKTINDNVFEDLTHGNMALGRNGSLVPGSEDRGLLFACNVNEDNTYFDFIVDSTLNLSDLIRINQRRITSDDPLRYKAAGNQFSLYGSGANDFANYGVDTVFYYYNTDGQNEEPVVVNAVSRTESDTNRSCLLKPCLPPCLDSTEVEDEKDRYFDARGDYQQAMDKYAYELSSGDTAEALLALDVAAYHREKMDSSAWIVWLHSALDTVYYQPDTVRRWLTLCDSYDSDVRMAQVLFGDKQYTEAYALLDTIEARRTLLDEQEEDLDSLRAIFDIMRGQHTDSLASGILNDLKVSADSYTGIASTLARNLLILYGIHYPPVYNLPDTSQSQPRIKLPFTGNPAVSNEQFTLYPNPNSGDFYIQCLSEDCDEYDFSIYDLLGRMQMNSTLNFNDIGSSLPVQVEQRESLYIAVIYRDGVPIYSSKLLIRKPK